MDRFARSRVLVTGGTGFIGAHVARAYAQNGAEVAVLARTHADKISDTIKFYKGSITDFAFVTSVVKEFKPTVIVHAAAVTPRQDLSVFDREMLEVQMLGTQTILSAVAEYGHPVRLIALGSIEELAAGPAPFTEDKNPVPLRWYSYTKSVSTEMVRYAAAREEIDGVVLRLSVVYGPGQYGGMLVSNAIQSCLSNKKFVVPSGEQTRDFLYIDDAVEAILRASEVPVLQSKVLHIGSGMGTELTVRDAVKIIAQQCKSGSVQFVPFTDEQRRHECMDYRVAITRAQNELGWSPAVSFEEGIHKTIDWFKEVV